MANDIPHYKNIGKQVFVGFPLQSIEEVKGFFKPPPGLHMALDVFTCLLKSKSAKDNENFIDGKAYEALIKNPAQLIEIYNQFIADIDNNLANTPENSQKMEDLKMRIQKFNEDGRNFWDFNYHANQSQFGEKMTIASDAIFKIWDLKMSA